MNMNRGGSREPAVFGKDITLEPWTANLSDSQFIELLQFEVQQACRVYGVPPSMVYAAISGQNVTYANISQADMQFLKYVEALLRMDALARAELAASRLKSKTTTINDVRALEDEPPFPGDEYDQPGVPGGMEPAQQSLPGIGGTGA